MKRFLLNWLIRPIEIFIYKFGTAINWSALSSIGNSRVARLTILMPVIGYLIIFNSTIAEFLSTSLPARAETIVVADTWTYLYSKNLFFLYFGLLIFGVGVALYNIAVPRQIRKYPSVEDYILAMEGIETRNLVTGSFDNVIGMYFRNLKGEERSSMFTHINVGFPGDVSGDLHRLIEEMFLEVDAEVWDGPPTKEDRLGSRFWTGSGNLMTDEVIEVMYSGRRVDRGLLHALYAEAAKRAKDVFYIEHRGLEFSTPKVRFLVFLFYSSGLALTVLPSVLTSAMILKHW